MNLARNRKKWSAIILITILLSTVITACGNNSANDQISAQDNETEISENSGMDESSINDNNDNASENKEGEDEQTVSDESVETDEISIYTSFDYNSSRKKMERTVSVSISKSRQVFYNCGPITDVHYHEGMTPPIPHRTITGEDTPKALLGDDADAVKQIAMQIYDGFFVNNESLLYDKYQLLAQKVVDEQISEKNIVSHVPGKDPLPTIDITEGLTDTFSLQFGDQSIVVSPVTIKIVANSMKKLNTSDENPLKVPIWTDEEKNVSYCLGDFSICIYIPEGSLEPLTTYMDAMFDNALDDYEAYAAYKEEISDSEDASLEIAAAEDEEGNNVVSDGATESDISALIGVWYDKTGFDVAEYDIRADGTGVETIGTDTSIPFTWGYVDGVVSITTKYGTEAYAYRDGKLYFTQDGIEMYYVKK